MLRGRAIIGSDLELGGIAMSSARIGGWQISYTETGIGFPVVYIHGGFGGVASALAPPGSPVREALRLTLEGFGLIEYDRRNCGRSEMRSAPYTQADIAEETAGLLEHLGIEEAVIIGDSTGGTIAQSLALARPEMVSALALVETSAHMKDAPFYAPMAEMVEFASREGSDVVFERRKETIYNPQLPTMRRPGVTEGDRREMRERLAAQINAVQEAAEEQVKAIALGELCNWRAHLTFDTRDRLSELAEHGVLVLHGDSDSIVPTEHAVELADGIPGSELVLIPSGDHGILMWPQAREALRSWIQAEVA